MRKNRVIKFRAWDTITKSYWTAQSFQDGKTSTLLKYVEDSNDADLLMELEQFTGLQDKNGKDIYEGDIYKSNYYTGIPGEFKRIIGVISFHGCGFVLEGINKYEGLRKELHRLGEIIGSIHENPDYGTQE